MKSFKLVIVGAGTGGISLSAKLSREMDSREIAIIDPAEFHYYQPLWTLVVDIGKVILAEFGYDGKLMPTFPVDPAIPRASMWYLKRYLLPALYWNVMMKGRG